MAYTPPAANSVNFEVTDGYTPPAANSVDFAAGAEPTTDIIVYLTDFPFVFNNSISSDVVQVEPLEALEATFDIAASPLWFAPLEPLISVSSLGVPGVLISLNVVPFNLTSSITGTTQRRVKLFGFAFNTSLTISGIAIVPFGFDIVAPQPFVNNYLLAQPDYTLSINVSPFTFISTIDTPLITAGETTIISPPGFDITNTLTVDIQNDLYAAPFQLAFTMDILAIKSMPAGDQYTVAPPFNHAMSLSAPDILEGVFVPAFEMTNELSIDVVFSGVNIEVDPFLFTQTMQVNLQLFTVLEPFEIDLDLEAELLILIAAPSFDLDFIFSDVVIYDGAFIEAPSFNLGLSLAEPNLSINLNVDPALSMVGSLGIPILSSFLLIDPFVLTSSLSVTKILEFSVDLVDVYYFLDIPGIDGFDSITLPMSTFQCTMRNGDPTYLQVTVPGLDFAEDIGNLIDSEIQVSMAYVLGGELVRKQVIVTADIETVSVYEGVRSKSIVISGHKTETFIPKELTLLGETYRQTVGGLIRSRIAVPNIDLAPGDLVTVGSDQFNANEISYYFKATQGGITQNMEVAE